MAPNVVHNRGRALPPAAASHPQKLAVIAPLQTEGPVTYQTLLEYLDQGPIRYQLWLLVQVPATPAAQAWSEPVGTPNLASPSNVGDSATAHLPAFAPVTGVNATPLTWPDSPTPRVVTIQYSGLQINQAINWAIRQASGDMILVLDGGLNGLLQLRQMLDEISAAQASQTALPTDTPAVVANVPATTAASAPAVAATAQSPSDLANDVPPHGALNRRLLERLEQWGMALQRGKQPTRRRVPPHKMDFTNAIRNASLPVEADVDPSHASPDGNRQRIDTQTDSAAPKKLPKFITRFHEFI